MIDPVFFDCLTDAQCWSLFVAGVLDGQRLPLDVYQRLERMAPEHGCCLFAWPVGMAPPALHDLLAKLAATRQQPPERSAAMRRPGGFAMEPVRAAVADFCARAASRRFPGRRIYILRTTPRLELRPGPYLELRRRDLDAMSLAELEAYLDDVLRLEEDGEVGAAGAAGPSGTP
jgi:hypothetical protein